MRIVHMQAIVATMSRDDIPAPAQLRVLRLGSFRGAMGFSWVGAAGPVPPTLE